MDILTTLDGTVGIVSLFLQIGIKVVVIILLVYLIRLVKESIIYIKK